MLYGHKQWYISIIYKKYKFKSSGGLQQDLNPLWPGDATWQHGIQMRTISLRVAKLYICITSFRIPLLNGWSKGQWVKIPLAKEAMPMGWCGCEVMVISCSFIHQYYNSGISDPLKSSLSHSSIFNSIICVPFVVLRFWCVLFVAQGFWLSVWVGCKWAVASCPGETHFSHVYWQSPGYTAQQCAPIH